jgi:hypothetical protein
MTKRNRRPWWSWRTQDYYKHGEHKITTTRRNNKTRVNKMNTISWQLGGTIRPWWPKRTWKHDDHEGQKTMVIRRNDKTMMTKKTQYHDDKEE